MSARRPGVPRGSRVVTPAPSNGYQLDTYGQRFAGPGISTDGADRMEQVAGLFLKGAPAHLHFSPRSEGRLPIGHRSGQEDPPVIREGVPPEGMKSPVNTDT